MSQALLDFRTVAFSRPTTSGKSALDIYREHRLFDSAAELGWIVPMDSHKRRTQLEGLEVVETGRRRRRSDDEKLRIVTGCL